MLHYPQSVVRPVRNDDLDALMALAKQAGPGMTNLPQNKAALQEKIDTSLHSFANCSNNSEIPGYFFVLEDIPSGQIVGSSGICGAGTHMMPFYHFKMSQVHYVNHELNLKKSHRILTMVNDYQGCTEICSLFVNKKFREHHNGSLMSRARFLFMASFPERFNKTIIAEMRGVMNDDGTQPFWDDVISKFIDLPFTEADSLTGRGVKQFISDLMPRYPIYVDMLSEQAQSVIDQVHEDTKPALKMLENEGFKSHGYIDIFEAGRMVECELGKIKTVRKSETHKVNNILSGLNSNDNQDLYLVCNAKLDFRACITHLGIDIDKENKTLSLSEETAKILDVTTRDNIRYVPLNLNVKHKN